MDLCLLLCAEVLHVEHHQAPVGTAESWLASETHQNASIRCSCVSQLAVADSILDAPLRYNTVSRTGVSFGVTGADFLNPARVRRYQVWNLVWREESDPGGRADSRDCCNYRSNVLYGQVHSHDMCLIAVSSTSARRVASVHKLSSDGAWLWPKAWHW